MEPQPILWVIPIAGLAAIAFAIYLAWDVLRPGATAIVVGIAPYGVDVALPALELISEKGIRGSYYGSGDAASLLASMAGLAAEGRFPLADVVTHLTEVIRAHAAELLTRQETHHLLDQLKEVNAAVVDEVVPDVLSLGEI